MATPQELAMQNRQSADQLKEPYLVALQAMLALIGHDGQLLAPPEQVRAAMTQAHSAALAYFNAYERMAADIDLLKLQDNADWVVNIAQGCYNVLETVVEHYKTMREVSGRLKSPPHKPSTFAYSAMQGLVARSLSKADTERLKKQFQAEGMPVAGFKAKPKSKPAPPRPQPGAPQPPGHDAVDSHGQPSHMPTWVVAVGVLCVIATLGIAGATFSLGNLTEDQRFFAHHFMFITAGIAAGAFVGSLAIKSDHWIPNLALMATGGFAIWLIAYSRDPEMDGSKRGLKIELFNEDGTPLREALPLDVRYGDEDQQPNAANNGTANVSIPRVVGKVDSVAVVDPRYEVEKRGPYKVEPNRPIHVVVKMKPGVSGNPAVSRTSVTLFLYDESDDILREELNFTVQFGDQSQQVRSSRDGSAIVPVPAGFVQIDRIACDDARYQVETKGPYAILPGQGIRLTLKPRPAKTQ